MAGGYEQLFTLLAAIVQLLVAYWWFRAPPLGGTRWYASTLFLLNGLASGLAALEVEQLRIASQFLDRLTNPVALALAARLAFERDSFARWALGVSAALVVPVAVAGASGWSAPYVLDLAIDSPLFFAMVLACVAVVRTRGDAVDATTRFIVLGGLLTHWADVSVSYYLWPFVGGAPFGGPGWWQAYMIVRLVAPLAMALAMGAALTRRRATPAALALALLVAAGLLIGAARPSTEELSAVYLSLSFVRPVAFLVALDLALDFEAARRRRTALAIGVAGAIAGYSIATFWWSRGQGAALALAAGVAFAAPTLALLVSRPRRTGRAWPLDERLVGAEAEALTDQHFARYLALPEDARSRLEGLPRWKRLLMALGALPPTAPGRARSTAALHLATHCPYASIGAEVRRANARAATILRDLGLTGKPGPLVEVEVGRVEGSRSARTNVYTLTAAGRLASETLWTQAGLTPDVALLGELFGARSKAVFDGQDGQIEADGLRS